MVLVPGWRWTARTMARVLLYQLAVLVFSTLSMTRPELLQADRRAVPIGHHHLPVGGRLEQLPAGFDGIGLFCPVQSPGRQIDVGLVNGGRHFVDADLAGGQRLRIKLGPHGIFLRTEHIDLGHAADGGDTAGDQGLGIFVNRGKRQRGGAERQVEDRLIGRIDLAKRWRRRHVFRQRSGWPARWPPAHPGQPHRYRGPG